MFIELHFLSGQSILVNPNQIATIEKTNPNSKEAGKTVISFPGNENTFIVVNESYDEVKKLLNDLHYIH